MYWRGFARINANQKNPIGIIRVHPRQSAANLCRELPSLTVGLLSLHPQKVLQNYPAVRMIVVEELRMKLHAEEWQRCVLHGLNLRYVVRGSANEIRR